MAGVVTNVVTWRGMGERKTANSLRISGLLWCHQESNRGHKDFQSFALPTELWHRMWIAAEEALALWATCFPFAVAKLRRSFELCKYSRFFFEIILRIVCNLLRDRMLFLGGVIERILPLD